MHVGALVIFEGPPPSREDFVAHIESRLHLVPRYRQKLAFPRFEMGRPFWVDDPSFNLDYHVRHTALPQPGLRRPAAPARRAHLLPAARPLEAALGGLARSRASRAASFALISKTHHALVDGVSGVDIATVLFDLQPVPPEVVEQDEWVPSPEPSDVDLVAEGVKGLVRTPVALAGRALGRGRQPGPLARAGARGRRGPRRGRLGRA